MENRSACSRSECGFHADLYPRGVLPADMPEEVGEPWRAPRRLRVERVFDPQARIQAVLDHKELVG